MSVDIYSTPIMEELHLLCKMYDDKMAASSNEHGSLRQ